MSHAPRAVLWNVSGPLLTLAAAITIEVLSQTWLQIPNPPAILLLIVVFSAFTGGLPSGLASAVIAWLYFAYFFSTPRGSFGYTDENVRRVILWAITTPAMALMVGILKRRADWAQAERARRESEARKGAILEAALDCIISIDHEGRVIDFNPAAEQMFGYMRAQIVGKEMCELLIPPNLVDDDPNALKLMEATLKELGYRPLSAPDDESGLRIAQEAPPAAVVLDLEFLDRFRRTATGRRIPVIVWTVKDLTAEERAPLLEELQVYLPRARGRSGPDGR